MDKNTGRVHSFESFGTVDGPGIRFVIFFQGCHLKCKYCHNRDLWDFNGGDEYTANELFAEVQKYRPFFEPSGGGVTASGGDPVLQASVITELFTLCQKAGIHTTLDTSGAVPLTLEVEKLLDVTDLVLLDIKHIYSEKAIELTGKGSEQTLYFSQYLSQKNIPMWIRQVIIPGFTDDPSDLDELSQFIGTLESVEKVELLPFHKMGEYKWDELDVAYDLRNVDAPTEGEMKKVLSHFANLKIPICCSN